MTNRTAHTNGWALEEVSKWIPQCQMDSGRESLVVLFGSANFSGYVAIYPQCVFLLLAIESINDCL